MTSSSAPPNTIPWPPIILAGGIAAGVALGHFYPLPWPAGQAGDIVQGAGFAFVALAALIYYLSIRELRRHRTAINPTRASSIRELRRHRTAINPTRASSHLVTSGPFAFSRNPIYLANGVLTVGLGLATGNLWLAIIAFVAAYGEQQLGIVREERHLEARYGKAWRDYAKRVRRWI